METYFANQPVSISIPLVTSNGSSVTDATNASFRVLDSAGTEIVAATPFDIAAGQALVEIELPVSASQLAAGEVRAYRQVEVTFTSAGKVYTNFEEYLIELADALVPMVNSFQNYGSAMQLSAEITGLDSFSGAVRRDRIAALVNSYNVLSRLRYSLGQLSPVYDIYQAAPGWRSANGHVNLFALDAAAFEALPKHFVMALKRAQIIEADEALNGFSILKKRQQGLMSETIGESSMMFRPEKVLNIPVTRRSMDMLRPYLVWDVKIGRG